MGRKFQGRAKDPAHADAPLQPGALPALSREDAGAGRSQPPAAWIAQALIAPAKAAAARALYVASCERRADEIARALRHFAPDIEVLALPPWDCLPYDRASPSHEVMGRRMAALRRLHQPPGGSCVVVAPVETLLQKTAPASAFARAFMDIRTGQSLERGALEAFARACGYVAAEHVDEPGEYNILGEVVDIIPPEMTRQSGSRSAKATGSKRYAVSIPSVSAARPIWTPSVSVLPPN